MAIPEKRRRPAPKTKRAPKTKGPSKRELREALAGLSDEELEALRGAGSSPDAEDVVYVVPLGTERGRALAARLGLDVDALEDDEDDEDDDDDDDEEDDDDGGGARDREPPAAHGFFRERRA